MIRFFNGTRPTSRDDYWLAGQFDRRAHPFADRAMAGWSEILGREGAQLWLDARARDGRGR